MRFFQAQEEARQKTRILLFIYVCLCLGMSALTGLIAISIIAMDANVSVVNLTSFGMLISVLTLITIILTSAFRISQLSFSGGIKIAEMSGGQQVLPSTRDSQERLLLNVVEEMALACGLPAPTAYILKQEHSINAFAAGNDSLDSVIAVTQGTLDSLSREELQGVVAHEMGHIRNGDTKLNIRLLGLAFGFTCINYLGRELFQSRRNQSAVLGALLYFVGLLGLLFGKILKASISRQREFHADASAVQFTRNPHGLVSALKKIMKNGSRNQIQNFKAQEASHMFMVDGFNTWAQGLLATHPPLYERIKALDPSSTSKSKDRPSVNEDIEMAHRFSSASTPVAAEVIHPSWIYTLCLEVSPLESREAQRQLLHTFNEDSAELPANMTRIEIIFKVLNQLKHEAQEKNIIYLKNLKMLIEVDRKVGIEEYLIYSVVRETLLPKKRNLIRDKKLSQLKQELNIIERLFRDKYSTKLSLREITDALENLKDLRPLDKVDMLEKITKIMYEDGQQDEHEKEIYALLCLTLGLPWELFPA
jgi:Zn-dependent protease with chaperone function